MYELAFEGVHGYVHGHAPGYCIPLFMAVLYESMLVPIKNGSQPELENGSELEPLGPELDGPGKTNPTEKKEFT